MTITAFQHALEPVLSMDVHRVHQVVRLTYTIVTCGGRCPWLLCRVCRRRVGVLYHANGLPFRCRICCDLDYSSQYQSRDRSHRCQHRMVSPREWDRISVQCAERT